MRHPTVAVSVAKHPVFFLKLVFPQRSLTRLKLRQPIKLKLDGNIYMFGVLLKRRYLLLSDICSQHHIRALVGSSSGKQERVFTKMRVLLGVVWLECSGLKGLVSATLEYAPHTPG